MYAFMERNPEVSNSSTAYITMTEKTKTILLSVLIILAVSFIVYVWGGYEEHFVNTLR